MKKIKVFAEDMSDAYSTGNYRGGWSASIKMLRQRGYDDRQIEAIIRSKWTRWASDMSGKRYGQTTSADLARFIDSQTNLEKQVAELVDETFA